MSQQHIDIWNAAADAFTQRYEAVTEDQWAASTPCEKWTVKELVDHTVGVQVGFTAGMVGAEVPEGADWPATRDAIQTALAADGALDGTTEFGDMGTVPKMVPFGVSAGDLLVHTWDLARAIGADEQLPPQAVSATFAGMQRFPEEAMRGSEMFGPALDCADDADEQAKLLAFCGRQV